MRTVVLSVPNQFNQVEAVKAIMWRTAGQALPPQREHLVMTVQPANGCTALQNEVSAVGRVVGKGVEKEIPQVTELEGSLVRGVAQQVGELGFLRIVAHRRGIVKAVWRGEPHEIPLVELVGTSRGKVGDIVKGGRSGTGELGVGR